MSRIAINAMAMGQTKAGVGRFIAELFNAQIQADRLNEYVVFTTEFGAQHLRSASNCRVLTPSMSRPTRLAWEQTVLPVLLRKYRVDLLHGQGFTLPFVKMASYVVTIYDMTWFSHATTHERAKTLYFRQAIPMAIRRADRILAISDSAHEDIIRVFPQAASRTITTHGGVAKLFHDTPTSSEQENAICARYGVARPFLLSVGMIQPRKNLPRLLKAFHHLRTRHQNAHQLVIVGKQGWNFDEVFTSVKQLGLEDYVKFTGFVPDEDLVHLYRACDVLAYPSLYEGFGLPIVEAMAAGSAVVTSDNSSMREVAGDAAELCDPESEEDITRALLAVIRDNRHKETLVARGRVQAARFTWENTARRTLDAYNEVLADAR